MDNSGGSWASAILPVLYLRGIPTGKLEGNQPQGSMGEGRPMALGFNGGKLETTGHAHQKALK